MTRRARPMSPPLPAPLAATLLLAAACAVLPALGCASPRSSRADLGRTYDEMRRERSGFSDACDWDRPESTRKPSNSNQNSLGTAACVIAGKEGISSLF